MGVAHPGRCWGWGARLATMTYRSRRRGAPRAALAGLILVLALGCTQPSPDPPTASPAVSGDRVQELMLTVAEMPGGTWEAGGPVSSDGFGQTICGVNTEPVTPEAVKLSRRTRPDGVEVSQTVRSIGPDAARQVLDALARAIPDCARDTRTVNGQTITYEVEPLASASPGVVAFTQTSVGGAFVGLSGAQAYFVRDGYLVAFSEIGADPAEAADLLHGLVAAVEAK